MPNWIILGFFVSFLGTAAATELEVSPALYELPNCQESLRGLARISFAGLGRHQAGLGLGELDTLLMKSGYSDKGQRFVGDVLRQMGRELPPDSVVVRTLQDAIAMNPSDAKDGSALIICVGSADCASKMPGPPGFNFGLHGAEQHNLRISEVAINTSDQPPGEAIPKRDSSQGLTVNDFIVVMHHDIGNPAIDLNYPDKSTALKNRLEFGQWISQFVRDLTKHSTHRILSDWVKKNVEREPEKRDALFKRYVSAQIETQSGGPVQVYHLDDKFYYTVFTGRAIDAWTSSESWFYNKYLGIGDERIQSLIEQQEAGHLRGGFKELSQISPRAIEWFKIDSSNLFEKTRKIVDFIVDSTHSAN